MTWFRFPTFAPTLLALPIMVLPAHANSVQPVAADPRRLMQQALRLDMELESGRPLALERANGLALAMRQAAGIDVAECRPGWNGRRDPIEALFACARDRKIDLVPFMAKGIAAWLATFDPYAAVYSPEDLARLGAVAESERDKAGAVGLALAKEGDSPFMVVGVTPGMPADVAGIGRYARIVAIDGAPVADMPLDEGIARLHGPVGSTVSLAVLDAKGSRTLSIVRRPFKPAAPKLQRLPGVRIGLVATAGESGLMLPEMAKSILSAKSDLHGIILDLRKDSGGLLDAYIRTADVFLSQGAIVTVRGHPDELYNAHAVSDPADAFLENVPLVVLVDPVTAAGAEIVVAALQDHRRATVIGQQTFGRGTVQTFFMLGQGWAMKLTTGQLVRPEGSSLSQGVKPDCASDLRDQALVDWVAQRMARGEAFCPANQDITPQAPISAQTR